MANPFGQSSWNQTDYARKRWQQDYDDYLKRIEQYKGSSFYNELLNNPYYQFQDYQANFFQGVWANSFDDYSAWDKFYNDRKTSGDEYLAQILDAQRQQQFSDPQAEVARRQAAGLNDDLNGGQAIGTGEPGAAAPDDTPPESAYTDPLITCASVAQVGFQLFQSGMSLISFIQDTAGKQLTNARLDVDLTDTAFDQAVKLLAGSSSLPGSREEYDALTEEQRAGLDDQLIRQLEASIARGQYKGMYQTKTAKRLMSVLRGVVSYDKDGKPTLAYEAYRSKLLAQRYGDHKTAAGVIGTPGFSESLEKFGSAISDTFGKIDLAIRQADQKLKEAQARSATAQAGYDESYLGSDLARANRAAGIAVAGAQQTAAENQRIIEDMRKEINEQFEALRELANQKGGIEGMILKLLIPIARSQTEQIVEKGFGATLIDRSGLGGAVGSAAGALFK